MTKWLEISPILNGYIVMFQLFIAMFTREFFVKISPLLFSMLFANIIVSFILALLW